MSTDSLTLAKELGLYVHSTTICTSSLYIDEDQEFSIYWQEGISHSTLGWAPLLNNEKSLFLTTLPWYHDEVQFAKQAAYVKHVASALNCANALNRFIILCNAPEEAHYAKLAGFKNSILCNHNAFLDPIIYAYDASSSEDDRIYNLVLNCRPEKWKRPFFASNVQNLAIIKGHNFRPHEYFDLAELRPEFLSSQRLSPAGVVRILNQSRTGGIFSAVEGGCYSSSEYLLCGLPVVSSPSKGGRDVWYNSDNAVIVGDPLDVPAAVEELAQRCRRDLDLRASIRQRHIDLASEMRGRMISLVEDIANQFGRSLIFGPIFAAKYCNKVTQYKPAPTS